jgi:hypothetical protein
MDEFREAAFLLLRARGSHLPVRRVAQSVPENPPPNCSSRAPRVRCARCRGGTVTPKGEPRTEARISETVSRACQALFGVHPLGPFRVSVPWKATTL